MGGSEPAGSTGGSPRLSREDEGAVQPAVAADGACAPPLNGRSLGGQAPGTQRRVRCRDSMRLIACLFISVISSCSSRRSPAVAREVGSEANAGGQPQPRDKRTHERVVHLSPAGSDTSCLDRAGGTVVAGELSDEDVRRIEVLVRRTDTLPIAAIGHLAMLGDRRNPPGPEFEARTGAGCGPLSGHGSLYRVSLVNGDWVVTERGTWVS